MSTKNRIRLVVQYDGTDFCGWAAQSGQRTVQSTLKEAVRQISDDVNEIIGASRTDAGAHACGQVCHFDTANPIPEPNWVRALNDLLPGDIAVQDSKRVPQSFHSRFCATWRFYRYRFAIGTRQPLRSRYAHTLWKPLDLEAMSSAAQTLVGRHDFWSFSEETPAEANTVRELQSVRVRSVRDEIWLDIVGNAFIRGMMRRIAGGLMEVGQGTRPIQDFPDLLHTERREGIFRPIVLPARGLCLMNVRYGRHPKDFRENSTNEDE